MTQYAQPDVATHDRMMLYVWSESDKPDECKFGERWVHANTSAEASVLARVKESLGVRKDLLKSGVVTIDHYWDVSDWAQKVGRSYQAARMDDHVRGFVGFRKNTTGEIHTLSSDELILKVNRLIAQQNQPLPKAAISTMQAEMAEQVIAAYDAGKQVILAELCARFGKTIWSGVVARELESELVIVTSYVKTVFASFAKDLTSFAQWADYVHVNTQDADWQQQVSDAFENGQRVIAYVSMAPGGKRDARIVWLMNQTKETLLILDEADFGSHTPKQAQALKSCVKCAHRVLIMTGTNSDRAIKLWQIDHMVSVTYPELLVQKTTSTQALAAGALRLQPTISLSHFERDLSRDCVMPHMSMYQLDLSMPVAQSAALGEMDADMKLLPSWAKLAAHPVKSKGFFVRILETVLLGKHQVESANVDLQTLNWFGRDKQKVAMMFLPHQTGVHSGALKAVGQIAQQTLPAWRVVVLGGGDIRVDNQRVKNHNAEATVREQVEKARKLNQSVLIIASQMAQRSFSIPEITELYLAYDAGQSGATIQKMSRVLTPGTDPNKVGKIISLSFDPNRDDKFDALVLETTKNLRVRYPQKTASELMAQVLSTLDIWKGGAHTGVRINKDEFLREAIARKSVSKVIGNVADLSKLNKDEIKALAAGHIAYSRIATVANVPKGKTKQNAPKKASVVATKDVAIKLQQMARERIVAVSENTDVLLSFTGCDLVSDAIAVCDADPDIQTQLQEEFGLEWFMIRKLYVDGVINADLLNLKMESACS
jgi:hypothetical protein